MNFLLLNIPLIEGTEVSTTANHEKDSNIYVITCMCRGRLDFCIYMHKVQERACQFRKWLYLHVNRDTAECLCLQYMQLLSSAATVRNTEKRNLLCVRNTSSSESRTVMDKIQCK